MSRLCEHCADPSWTGQTPIKAPRLPTGDYILEFDTKDEFPEKGEGGFLYVDLSNNNFYKWDLEAEEYVLIGAMGDTDVVDIVPTYADLEAYDTSKLKDRDIIKVLADETEGGKITYYRWLKTESKWELVGSQESYYSRSQIDTMVGDLDDLETEDKTNLVAAINEVAAAGVKVLTSADYNYPTDNPDSIAIWLLEDGIYVVGERGLKYWERDGGSYSTNAVYIVVSSNGVESGTKRIQIRYNSKDSSNKYGISYDIRANGSGQGRIYHLDKEPYNGLDSQWIDVPLAANQGRILKNIIDTRVPAPTVEEVDKFLRGDGTWASAGSASVSNHTLFV